MTPPSGITEDSILNEDLAHLSPTRYARVNPYARYRFDPGVL